MTLREIEKEAIIKAFADNKENRDKTASALGISVRTLDYRLQEYGMKKKLQNEIQPKSDIGLARFEHKSYWSQEEIDKIPRAPEKVKEEVKTEAKEDDKNVQGKITDPKTSKGKV